jgi:hypothetical protein
MMKTAFILEQMPCGLTVFQMNFLHALRNGISTDFGSKAMYRRL